MKLKIKCRDYEVVRLPYPLSKVIAALSTYKDGCFIFNPKEALLTVYKAKKISESILRYFIDKAMDGSLIEGPMITSAIGFKKHIEIRVTPLFPVKDMLKHVLMIHIPEGLREFEVSDDIGELMWLKGKSIVIPAREFLKRIAWAVIYHGLDLNVLIKLRGHNEQQVD